MTRKINTFAVAGLPSDHLFFTSGTKSIFDFKPAEGSTVNLKIEIEQETKEDT